jgi:hypothetical protein
VSFLLSRSLYNPPFLEVQDAMAISAQGDTLLLSLADSLLDVVLFENKIIHRAFVVADYVVKVNDRGVGETAAGAGLFGAVV